jgi:iron complex outermembrane receptor protein
MVLAPHFSLNGIARYHFKVAGGHELALQVDSHYTGRQFFDLTNDPIATEGGNAVTNASIAFNEAGGHLSASVWARNLTNRQYRLYAVPVTSLGQEQQMYGPPRWFGLSVGYKW